MKDSSNASGETGLFLSIVKYGAIYQSAQISIESENDKGSKVEIIFKNYH